MSRKTIGRFAVALAGTYAVWWPVAWLIVRWVHQADLLVAFSALASVSLYLLVAKPLARWALQ